MYIDSNSLHYAVNTDSMEIRTSGHSHGQSPQQFPRRHPPDVLSPWPDMYF